MAIAAAVTLLGAALASAAPPPPPDEAAYREARAALDRGDLFNARQQIQRALQLFGEKETYWVWGLQIMQCELLTADGFGEETLRVLAPEPPARWASTEMAVRRLLAMARASDEERPKLIDRAEAIAEAHQPQLRAEVLLQRARSSSHQQAVPLALRAIELAKQRRDRLTEARAELVLGRVLGFLERYDEAIAANRRGIAAAKVVNATGLVKIAEGNIGSFYFAVGDLDSAERLIAPANEAAVRLGLNISRPPFLILLGNIAYRRRDFAKASRFYAEAAAVAKRTKHDVLPQALANLALVALETGNAVDAARYSREALALKRKQRDSGDAEAHSLLTDARIAQTTGGYNDAESLYQRVIDSAQSKSLQWEARARLGQLLALRKKPELADAQFRLAVETVEDARSELKADELKLAFPTTVIEFYDAYIEFLVGRGRVEDALEVAELSRARALERRGGVGRRNLDARRVAREAGATILSYWLAAPRSYLWIVTPQGVSIETLPKDDEIGRQVEAYQKALRSPSGSLARSGQLGQQLYATLIPQAAAKAIRPGSRVIVIADDRLHALNFETLVTPQDKYWIEDVVVTTAASMQLLGAPRTASASGSVLVIGNPPAADPAFPPLPRAGEEIKRVARHFDGRKTVLLEGKAATPSAYRTSQPQAFAFIHFVAHGTANRQVPLESAVILARDADSYKLYARDIIESPLSARLVTISSCHGAGVRAYASEGLVGLAWAFLRAGAHQVVAALWEVNDVATPELMDRMYADIRAGRDPATALRNAKLSMIHSQGVYRKPLYWAPFVLYSGS